MDATRILTNRDRAAALAVTACLYLLAALLAFLVKHDSPVRDEGPAIAAFDVAPADPVPSVAAKVPVAKPAGAAAPAGQTGIASPVEAPVPMLAEPPPIVASPVAEDGAAAAGAADTGIGAAAGGTGTGRGAGGSGGGRGSGAASPARLLRGAIGPRDYPREARRAGAQGVVTVRFTVGTDGRPRGCTTIRSSGSDALDDVTCRLIERRYRYAPARDAAGAAVAEERGWQQRWWLERADADAEPPAASPR